MLFTLGVHFKREIDNYLRCLLGSILEFVELLLQLSIPCFSILFLLREIVHSVLILLLYGIDLCLDVSEFVVELLSVLLCGLFIICGH